MRRREVLAGLAGAAAWPLGSRAQHDVPAIGFLSDGRPELYAQCIPVLLDGLREMGFEIDRTAAIKYRWAQGDAGRLPQLAEELVAKNVAVIAAVGGIAAARAAKTAAGGIPVVFYTADPVEQGLVAGMDRPGGNLTGVASLNAELMPRRVELLRELVPDTGDIGLLVNPVDVAAANKSGDMAEAMAGNFGVKVHVLSASREDEFEDVFAKIARLKPSALAIANDPLFDARATALGKLSMRHGVPAAFQYREFVASGGLVGYGGSFTAPFRTVGAYVGRVLKGEKPADMAVQRVSNLETALNLKTASVLDITVPMPLVGRADVVIE